MSAIDDAIKSLRKRLAEIEKDIGSLNREADAVREAIAKIETVGAGAGAPARPARASTRGARRGRGGAAAARRSTAAGNGRAPRGANRSRILEAIKTEAKTAGQVADETGISRGTVATTLTKLVGDKAAVKAERGYRAA
jgi:hypothetical protein